MNIKNIAFYAFFKPSFDLELVRSALLLRMRELSIKGTILLATEGINCSLCGTIEEMDKFLAFLCQTVGISTPELKVSFSDNIPFKRTLVKIKPYIVAKPGDTPIDPMQEPAPYVSPEKFHQWIKDNKDMIILDTRNDYEYEVGRFKNSIHLGTKHFSKFEGDLSKAPQEWQNKTIVTFCTGGIRCEKAAPLMLKKGFQNVYQLEGGILNYFKKVGRGYFEGECFVFDERIAVDDTKLLQ
jgi:UPF0176 protein